MTTLTAPAPSGTRRQAVPWTRLAWVTWRQHRAALAGAAAVLGGLSLLMLVNGLAMRARLGSLGLNACHPVTVTRCATQLALFDSDYALWFTVVPVLLQVAPVLAAVFTGGPLLARELETGTFRFAWTQGSGRTRWVLAKMVLLAVPLTAAVGAVSWLFSWWYQPLHGQGRSLMAPLVFNLLGVSFAAWTLTAFAIGAFAGVVIRRVVPAIGSALAASAGLGAVTALYLRYHVYRAAIVVRLPRHGVHLVPARSLRLSTWLTYPDGRLVPAGALQSLIQKALSAGSDPSVVLAQHQIGQDIAYQPEIRFWPFQLIEGGWLLALAVLLGVLTVWLARRRAA
jgi:hypothetical protein